MSSELLTLLAALMAGGALAGFAAGLFGIGGGAVMVPILAFVFSALGYPAQTVMHCAVATSSAVIIVSSIRSVRAHHARGAVDWEVLWPSPLYKSWGLWIGAGALLASAVLARYITGRQLELIFGAVMIAIALQFIDFRVVDGVMRALYSPRYRDGLRHWHVYFRAGHGRVYTQRAGHCRYAARIAGLCQLAGICGYGGHGG